MPYATGDSLNTSDSRSRAESLTSRPWRPTLLRESIDEGVDEGAALREPLSDVAGCSKEGMRGTEVYLTRKLDAHSVSHFHGVRDLHTISSRIFSKRTAAHSSKHIEREAANDDRSESLLEVAEAVEEASRVAEDLAPTEPALGTVGLSAELFAAHSRPLLSAVEREELHEAAELRRELGEMKAALEVALHENRELRLATGNGANEDDDAAGFKVLAP